MIKRPYNNQGEIQYVEITKIFLLISFFLGLLSNLTTGLQTSLSQTGFLVLFSIVLLALLIASVQELRVLLGLIKQSLILPLRTNIVLPYVATYKRVVHVVRYYTTPNIHQLQVVRC